MEPQRRGDTENRSGSQSVTELPWIVISLAARKSSADPKKADARAALTRVHVICGRSMRVVREAHIKRDGGTIFAVSWRTARRPLPSTNNVLREFWTSRNSVLSTRYRRRWRDVLQFDWFFREDPGILVG